MSSLGIFFASADVAGGAASTPTSASDFTSHDNLRALVQQALWLVIALVYLRVRNFDFRTLRFRPTWKGTAAGVGLFFAIGLLFDVSYWLFSAFTAAAAPEAPEATDAAAAAGSPLAHIDPSLLVYSAFNGFYEEFFFLGLCLAVAPRWRTAAFLYSLAVRVSFHTYQGLFSALFIGLAVGSIYYVVYRRVRGNNLYPLVFSHALADIFGASALAFLT